jgi:NADPH2:quinone reductase
MLPPYRYPERNTPIGSESDEIIPINEAVIMRTVVMREFGPPEVLQPAQVADVTAGPGEVVIDVELCGVTFVETQIRAGRPPRREMAPALPAILGNGVGGTIAGVGTGVDAAVIGRRVVSSLNGTGGYAQRAVAASGQPVDVPEGVALRDAVALLADGRTAFALINRAQLMAGQTVLVEAAAGGVGTLLVQLARNAGARVVALAGGQGKLALARQLGADVAVDYNAPDWPERVRKAAGSVDVVFDGVGGAIGQAAFGLLGSGGRFCPFGMASGSFAPVTADLAKERNVTLSLGTAMSPAENAALVGAVLAEAAAGRISPVIGQELALERAAEAHAAIEARTTTGKTLLTVTPLHRGADRLRGHALVHDAHPNSARRPGRRRGAQPSPAVARGVYPSAHGGALFAAAAGPAGAAEGHRDHPPGDERDRRAGNPDAGHAPG